MGYNVNDEPEARPFGGRSIDGFVRECLSEGRVPNHSGNRKSREFSGGRELSNDIGNFFRRFFEPGTAGDGGIGVDFRDHKNAPGPYAPRNSWVKISYVGNLPRDADRLYEGGNPEIGSTIFAQFG